MASDGILTAIQAALAGLGGGIEGAQQYREVERRQRAQQDALDYQRKRDALTDKRQQQSDAQNLAVQLAGLQAQGWNTPEAFASQRSDARAAAGSLIGSALQAAGGGTLGPAPSATGMKALQGGFATAADPTRKISIGGRDLILRETDDERQERLSQAKALQDKAQLAEAQRLQNMLVGRVGKEGLDSTAGIELAQQNPSVFNALASRANQKTQAGFEQQKIGLAQQQLALQKGAADARTAEAEDKKRKAKEDLSAVLPTVVSAAKEISGWGEKEVKKLSPNAIALLNQATLQGGLSGVLASIGTSQFTSNLDRRYLQYAGSISDAVARAKEVGVLTNQDINRFRNQVLFSGGENANDIRFKLNNLQRWAEWLAGDQATILRGDRAGLSLMPGESEEEAQKLRGWKPANPAGKRFEDQVIQNRTPSPSESLFTSPQRKNPLTSYLLR